MTLMFVHDFVNMKGELWHVNLLSDKVVMDTRLL